LVAQSGTSNTSATTAQAIDSAGKAVLISPSPVTAALSGYFKVTGFKANQMVKAQIVAASCATTGCSGTFDFSFTGPTGDDLVSTQMACGSKVFMADGAGVLTPSVAGGGSGGEGLCLLLTPQ
jgi:hypothetical protein